MATTKNDTTSRVQGNRRIYSHPYNIVTLVLWGLALGSHAVLIPLFIRQVLRNRQPSGLFS